MAPTHATPFRFESRRRNLRATHAAVTTLMLVCAAAVDAAAPPPPGEDIVVRPTAPAAAPAPQTLSGDWFGRGPTMRAAGLDLRLEWAQFYQGMTRGEGDGSWRYGGKVDALARLDLSRMGAWDGLSLTLQGYLNHGHSINGTGATLLPVNTALAFPGIEDDDRHDVMALNVTQRFGNGVSVTAGKLNMLELVRATPLKGGGGVDTFWGNVSAPISGMTPVTLHGLQVTVPTQPVGYTLMIYDPQDATNRPLFSDLFDNGVTFNGNASLRTSIAGLRGYYGVKAIYSTREGTDFSEIIRPPGFSASTRKGSWMAGVSFQQNLVQDAVNPARGWGVFGEISKSDGNPNLVEWIGYLGVGGTGLFRGRPDDRFGIAYLKLGVSKELKNELEPIFRLRDEWTVEAFYNVAVTPWLRITGNVQYSRPAVGSVPRAVYAGIGTYIRF